MLCCCFVKTESLHGEYKTSNGIVGCRLLLLLVCCLFAVVCLLLLALLFAVC